MVPDSLLTHYQEHELGYNLRMFFIGFSNQVTYAVASSFTLALAIRDGFQLQAIRYMIFLEGV